ncbi:beta-lactamase-like protein [Mycotypha africana]|uniref:beta-lactamase-like protein n=1 Tax=Mycotypha africana TaxID=64632 RepID=UPI002301314B|nr:beta-lactamase-like protein [Mycotypha africana]KAI8973190.1 beta-lactamase-like protein [Mycotypha africana]
MSTSSNVKAEKKRKLKINNKDSTSPRKQVKFGRATLQHYFNSTTSTSSTAKQTAAVTSFSCVEEPKDHHEQKIHSDNELSCPICYQQFNSTISMTDIESHVNACLDNSKTVAVDKCKASLSSTSLYKAPVFDSFEIDQQASNYGEATFDKEDAKESNCDTTNESVKTSNIDSVSAWSKLFDTAKFKIRGIWSSSKTDIAPGLTENEISWFGESKYSSSPTISTEKRKSRTVPYYKRLAGTNMVVDAFLFGQIPDCEGYFLSHFHSDHYMGLSANWTHGPIYCSEITAELVKMKLGVSSEFVIPLPLDTPRNIPTSNPDDKDQQITVTLLDANHCPGAVIFLFQVGKFRYLHTGDFRACPKMCLHPMLKDYPIDILYLDTTYLNPKYSFPSQDSCIKAACEVARRHNLNESVRYQKDQKIEQWFVQQNGNKHTLDSTAQPVVGKETKRLLVVVGTYSLGKERIFIEIAKILNSKIFVPDKKRAILETFGDSKLIDLLVNDPLEAQVHVIPIRHIIPENLLAYFRSLEPNFTEMVAFKPTGWTFRASADPKVQQQQKSLQSIIQSRPPDLTATALKPYYDAPSLKIYGIPYSEHSSFRELALFIASLDIRRIVPTVNIYSERSRSKMSDLFEKWNMDKKKMVEKNGGTIKVIDYPSVDYW